MFVVRFAASPKGSTLRSNLPTVILLAVFACAAGVSQDRRAGAPPGEETGNPDQLVSQVVANELKAQQTDHSLWRFRQTLRQDSGSQEMEFVQTSMGSVHRLLRRDGQPLSPDEASRENSRISHEVSHPDSVRKEEREEQKDGREAADLMRMLPEALAYRYAGTDKGVVTLEFTPNPSFKPHRHEGEVFHHMSGKLLVDAAQKRIEEIDGHLTSEVKFGGGILGHLDKGGTFVVNQKDVGGGHWELTRLLINMNGKALFFKTINVHHDEQDDNFQPVRGDITLEQAAELLRAKPALARQAQEGSQ